MTTGRSAAVSSCASSIADDYHLPSYSGGERFSEGGCVCAQVGVCLSTLPRVVFGICLYAGPADQTDTPHSA